MTLWYSGHDPLAFILTFNHLQHIQQANILIASMQERGASEDPETCDLCASSGPPKHPRRMDMTYDDTPDLQWIACQKCDKWLHSACVIASDSYKVTTIPAELREMIEWSGEGIWFDWADKVAKW